MGELEDLYMDPTKIYVFTTMEAEGERQDPVKLALAAPAPAPPPPLPGPINHYWPFQNGTFNVVLFVNCYVVFHFLFFL